MADDPCSAGFFSKLFSGNAIVCSETFQNYEKTQETAAIQSVADNASAAYGEGSAIAQLTQTTATQQEAQVTGDVADVTTAIADSTAGQLFTTCDNGDAGLALPGLPCVPWLYLGFGVGALVLLYVLALVSSVIPRSR